MAIPVNYSQDLKSNAKHKSLQDESNEGGKGVMRWQSVRPKRLPSRLEDYDDARLRKKC